MGSGPLQRRGDSSVENKRFIKLQGEVKSNTQQGKITYLYEVFQKVFRIILEIPKGLRRKELEKKSCGEVGSRNIVKVRK